MATSLVNPLPTIHPAYDPLIVALHDAGDPASGRTGQSMVEVQLEIEDTLNSDTWRLIGEFLNPYNYTTDQATVTLHKALLGALSPAIPSLSVSGAQPIPGLVKRYRLKVRDVIDGEPAGEFATLTPARAWLAGNSYVNQGTDITAGKAYLFLTTKSLSRRLHPTEAIHLQVLPIASGTPSVRIKAVFTDSTDQTNSVILSEVEGLVPFSVNVTLPVYAKPVSFLEIDLTGLAGTAEKLTYRLIFKPSPYFRQLYYFNSLGGLDHIPLTGKCEEINANTAEIFEAQEYPPSNGQVGNTNTFNERGSDSLILRTGWMTAEELKSLRDLTLRNSAYLVDTGNFRKLILASGTRSIKKDGEFLFGLEINAVYAFQETAYSR